MLSSRTETQFDDKLDLLERRVKANGSHENMLKYIVYKIADGRIQKSVAKMDLSLEWPAMRDDMARELSKNSHQLKELNGQIQIHFHLHTTRHNPTSHMPLLREIIRQKYRSSTSHLKVLQKQKQTNNTHTPTFTCTNTNRHTNRHRYTQQHNTSYTCKPARKYIHTNPNQPHLLRNINTCSDTVIHIITKTTSCIYNACNEHSKVPCSWKFTKTVLVPKSDTDGSCISNWRPICFQNAIYKIDGRPSGPKDLQTLLTHQASSHTHKKVSCLSEVTKNMHIYKRQFSTRQKENAVNISKSGPTHSHT